MSGVTIDGNDIVYSGTIRVVNGFNPDTGVAYLVLTPTGGVGTLPFFATGDSGLPPVFDSITMEEVDPSNSLPSPNPVVTLVSAGGAGEASHYTMVFYVHSGATGATGANTISTATDLATSPALGSATNSYILVYDSTSKVWVPSAQKVGDVYIPASLSSTASGTTSPRQVSSVLVPAQPFDWRPRCFAQTVVSGSSDTRVDLLALVNDPSSGDQVGYSKGIAGATPPPNVLIPAAPAGSSVPGTYGVVSAGSAATVYLVAKQMAPSSNSWSTPGDPDTTFWVEVAPVP